MAADADDGADKKTALSLAVEVEKDALTAQNDTIGIAQSYVARPLFAAADDIADIVVRSTNGQAVGLLVVTGSDYRSDADRATAVMFQIKALLKRVDAVLAPSATQPARPRARALGALAAGALELLPSAAATLTKVLAHQYTTAGAAIDPTKSAIDVRVAGAIRAKLGATSSMTVRIERLWTPENSGLLTEFTTLVDRYVDLRSELAAATRSKATAKDALDARAAVRTAGQARLLELSKTAVVDKAPATDNPWSIAWARATADADLDLLEQTREYEDASSRVATLEAVAGAIETLVVAVLTVDSSGGIPLLHAMRGEWLAEPQPAERLVLYVTTLHGGVDQVIETKLGSDKRAVLAGASVEFALVGKDDALRAAGVRDNLWGGVMGLDRLDKFTGGPVASAFERNERRTEPPETV